MPGSEILCVGKNAQVSAAAAWIVNEFPKQRFVVLETVGAGAVNQAVKAVAIARQQLEPEGYSLVIIPELVDRPLGHGTQKVVHLSVVDQYRI